MSKVLCEKSDLVAIADSVRSKTGTAGGMKITEIPKKIEAIETGGNINLQEKALTITSNGTITVAPDTSYDALSKVDVTVNVVGGGEDDLITFNIEVDFSNCPDADVTVWDSLDTDYNLTSNNHAAELKVQRGAVIAVISSNLIDGATTEENASFDIAGVEGEYAYIYDHSSSLQLSTWTYLVAVGTGGNDNFAYLVLSMREG